MSAFEYICVVFTIVMSILEPNPRRLLESIQRSYFIGGHKGRHGGRWGNCNCIQRCQRSPALLR